jgi:hypothetical protein
MSLFDRIAGTAEPKIGVWPIMMDLTRVLDGELTMEQLATIHSLDAAEQTEAGEYLTHCGSLVTARTTELVGAGIGVELATVLARGSVDNQLRYALLRAEHGSIDEATLRANLGIN